MGEGKRSCRGIGNGLYMLLCRGTITMETTRSEGLNWENTQAKQGDAEIEEELNKPSLRCRSKYCMLR
jgi:hypothetical protein